MIIAPLPMPIKSMLLGHFLTIRKISIKEVLEMLFPSFRQR